MAQKGRGDPPLRINARRIRVLRGHFDWRTTGVVIGRVFEWVMTQREEDEERDEEVLRRILVEGLFDERGLRTRVPDENYCPFKYVVFP